VKQILIQLYKHRKSQERTIKQRELLIPGLFGDIKEQIGAKQRECAILNHRVSKYQTM